ncbi:MAG: RNA-binding protein [Anaerovoracaceae bacterium]
MNEDRLVINEALDKIRQCEDRYMPVNSKFLDMHQQSVVRSAVPRDTAARIEFYGGYEEAERAVMFCLPDYMTLEDAADDAFSVIRAVHSEGSQASRTGRPLSHSDYLGSLLGLGIDRAMTGDILVRDDGCDIIVLKEIADFIEQNFIKAGRSPLHVEQFPLSELRVPESKAEEVHFTVASMRLDNLVSSGFNLSRTKAAEAIKTGLVFVDHQEAFKADMTVGEGAVVNLRHKGKIKISEVGGTTRKGRVSVNVIKY